MVVFDGIVRNNSRGRTTLYLEYEAYEAMAVAKMHEIGGSDARTIRYSTDCDSSSIGPARNRRDQRVHRRCVRTPRALPSMPAGMRSILSSALFPFGRKNTLQMAPCGRKARFLPGKPLLARMNRNSK